MNDLEHRLALIAEHAGLGAVWTVAPQPGSGGGSLAGSFVAWKDCFAVAGVEQDCGVPALRHTPAEDAVAVARVRAAGAASLGKLAMHQLAWGMTGQTPLLA